MGGPGSGRRKGGGGKKSLPASMRKVQTPAQLRKSKLAVERAAYAKQNKAYNDRLRTNIKRGVIG
jgi:hypothetical protein